MASDAAPSAWPSQLSPFWIESADVIGVETHEDERPGRDALGNPGWVLVVRHIGRLGVRWPRGRVVKRIEESGLAAVRADGAETEMTGPKARPPAQDVDPFLLEESVTAVVRGRDFPGQQRAVIEAKVEALRREVKDRSTPAPRKAAAGAILGDLEEGLRSTVEVRSLVRRFRPTVAVPDPIEAIGRVVPLHPGSRIVYRANPVKPESGEEGEAEPTVFHLVACGAREAVLIYTGDVRGQRHLRDLEESSVHHAWFADKERLKTDATAPWLGRRLFRDLMEYGCGEVVINQKRDQEPVSIERVGEDTSFVRIDGRPLEVPVIRCRTSRDDDLVVLNDPQSPLVLRLQETGADLIRTIDAIHSAPERRFEFPGDDELAAASKPAKIAAG